MNGDSWEHESQAFEREQLNARLREQTERWERVNAEIREAFERVAAVFRRFGEVVQKGIDANPDFQRLLRGERWAPKQRKRS